jgi:hypothetical protein
VTAPGRWPGERDSFFVSSRCFQASPPKWQEMVQQRTLVLTSALLIVMAGLALAYRAVARELHPPYLLRRPVTTTRAAALTVKSWQLHGAPGGADLAHLEVCRSSSCVWTLQFGYLVPLMRRGAGGQFRDVGYIYVDRETGRVAPHLKNGYRMSDLHAAGCRPLTARTVLAFLGTTPLSGESR